MSGCFFAQINHMVCLLHLQWWIMVLKNSSLGLTPDGNILSCCLAISCQFLYDLVMEMDNFNVASSKYNIHIYTDRLQPTNVSIKYQVETIGIFMAIYLGKCLDTITEAINLRKLYHISQRYMFAMQAYTTLITSLLRSHH